MIERKANFVARHLARKIVDTGWQVGDRLGREVDFLAELNVSRQIFREAVRILERQDVVSTRAGPKGGLIVKAPALEVVSNIVRNHIELAGSSFEDILDAYSTVMHLVLDRALARMTPAHAYALRVSVKRLPRRTQSRYEQGMVTTEALWVMCDISQNPCLSAFAHMLHRLVADFSHQERCPAGFWRDVLATVHDHTLTLVEQLSGRDPAAHATLRSLHQLTHANIIALEKANSAVWNTRSFLHGAYTSAFIGREKAQKSAVMLSYRLAAQIRLSEAVPGDRIGTETDIMKKHGVSRSVVLEALRMLEFLGIITVRRGRSAGAQVIEPDPSAVVDAATLYLSYYAPLRDDIWAVRQGLERGAMRRLAVRVSLSKAQILFLQVDALSDAPATVRPGLVRDAHASLLALSGNRVLGLLIAVLARAAQPGRARASPLSGERMASIAQAVRRVRTAITNASDGDTYESLETLCAALGGDQ